MPPRSTGLAGADAQDDFLRARRRLALSRLRRWLRREPGDIDHILPFEEVVTALGRLQERDAGLQVIPLDAIVGTVDRMKGFDRHFRPTTPQVRRRWESIATAMRRGEAMPPIDVYRIGEVYFVKDGHHRVSVARALGRHDIDARVTEVVTRVGAHRDLLRADLPLKSHERVFFERVPLPAAARERVRPSNPWDYAKLAEGIEAWGWRYMQEHGARMDSGQPIDRQELARAWYEEEYVPVVTMLRDAGMLGNGTEADAYMRIGTERYKLLRTHEWSEDVLARLRAERLGRRATD
ncbi:hypothetical protein DSM104299_02608 [Baekduia alba]|uniref:hypothetical protein n=1 Tax=Baekduia alba TaxID=2997333 RepID=UPI00233F806A|nr:hypothetical protein [Baekduia alba]WCB93887.1 hypothetical protein DSM104299_02608 [Baekduia alba]